VHVNPDGFVFVTVFFVVAGGIVLAVFLMAGEKTAASLAFASVLGLLLLLAVAALVDKFRKKQEKPHK